LSNGVTFLGALSRTDVAHQYAEATLFCHPSLEESQPMCLLEAMDAQVPIVASEGAGGVPWTLFNGRAGILADSRRPEALAKAVLGVISDEFGAANRSKNARDLMLKRYSPTVIAEQYISEYERVRAANGSL